MKTDFSEDMAEADLNFEQHRYALAVDNRLPPSTPWTTWWTRER